MKKVWKDILFTVLTLFTGFVLCLVWIYEKSLAWKIFDSIFLIGLPIENAIIMNKTIKK